MVMDSGCPAPTNSISSTNASVGSLFQSDAGTYFGGKMSTPGAHPVAWHWQNYQPVGSTGNMSNGKPKTVKFEMDSTNSHLMNHMIVTYDLEIEVTSEIWNRASSGLKAAVDGALATVVVSTPGSPTPAERLNLARAVQKDVLQNIRLHPWLGWRMLESVEYTHNQNSYYKQDSGIHLEQWIRYGLTDDKAKRDLLCEMMNGDRRPTYFGFKQLKKTDDTNTTNANLSATDFAVHEMDLYVNRKTDFGDRFTSWDTVAMTGAAGFGPELQYYPFLNTSAARRAGTNSDGMVEGGMGHLKRAPFEELAERFPTEPVQSLVHRYWTEGGHIIGFRDLREEVCANADLMEKQIVGKVITLPMQVMVPHLWWESVAESLPVLNMINNPAVTFNFKDYRKWVQNYADFPYFDMRLKNFQCRIKFYDIPRGIWDTSFPYNVQENFATKEYQWHVQDMTINVETTTGMQALANVNPRQFDRNSRSIQVYFVPKAWTTSDDRHLPYKWVPWYTVQKGRTISGSTADLKVNNERLLARINSLVSDRQRLDHMDHVNANKELVVLDDHIVFPLGMDSNFHSDKGGHLDLRPIANSLDVAIEIDRAAIWDLYNRRIYGFTYDDPAVANPLTHTHNQGAHLNDTIDSYDGQKWGAFQRLLNGTTPYIQAELQIHLVTVVLSVVSSVSGQIFHAA